MFSKLHDRMGTAGLAVAIVALIAALAGTAFAAEQGLNKKQKKQVEQIAKKVGGKPGPQGPKGDPGATGATGATGAKGDKGDKGDKGETGSAGTPGTPGANGKSVETGTATVGECPDGGATVQVETLPATKKKICNGKEGSPWTAGGVLPKGATETGSWFATIEAPSEVEGLFIGTAAISFAIPTKAIPTAVVVPSSGPVPGNCDDGALPAASAAHPEAKEGFLCVFVASGAIPLEGEGLFIKRAGIPGTLSDGPDTVGARVLVAGLEEDKGKEFWGTFAVTGAS